MKEKLTKTVLIAGATLTLILIISFLLSGCVPVSKPHHSRLHKHLYFSTPPSWYYNSYPRYVYGRPIVVTPVKPFQKSQPLPRRGRH